MSAVKPEIAVVIPTLNAEGEIGPLIDALLRQSVTPEEIVVVDSESSDGTRAEVRARSEARLIGIRRTDFNHGLTRDMALRSTSAEYVLFMTQDAVPADDRLLEGLAAPMLEDRWIALVSARQLPKEGARRFEQLVRAHNYPAERSVRDKQDVERLGLRAFFASDACSMYRRSAYLACGGFQEVVTYEDMLMAAALIGAGYRVCYEPAARVYHSHNLTPAQQYRRNRDGGRCLERHAADLLGAGAGALGEGGRLASDVAGRLLREGRIGEFFAFAIDCAARLAGDRAGRREARRETDR